MPEPKTQMIVPSFTVEADHPRNSDLLLQSIVNCRLRSAISASKGTIVNKQDPDNSPVTPEGQSAFLGAIPPVPGMQIQVDPANLTYKIVDPIHGNEEFCRKLRTALKNKGMVVGEKIDGVKPQEGMLDVHRMKTLCRELIWLMDAGEAKLVKGPKPDKEDVDELPGRYLLNPGSRVQNNQPVFEDQYEDYVNNLQKVGG